MESCSIPEITSFIRMFVFHYTDPKNSLSRRRLHHHRIIYSTFHFNTILRPTRNRDRQQNRNRKRDGEQKREPELKSRACWRSEPEAVSGSKSRAVPDQNRDRDYDWE
ncbi:hypothetical protein EVAR_21_1 [Eumeta japonica]|uniref:Uncharacterized protein n=1 Tax=Eumeta variegata TaxID=151549 RepID=A0A4C1SAV6_EUMVA|nr:hypothetical protein EVAR_21_1 [Eumeta japonica]